MTTETNKMNNLTKILGTGILALGISGNVNAVEPLRICDGLVEATKMQYEKDMALGINGFGNYRTNMFSSGETSPSITSADFDGDGDLDVVIAYNDHRTSGMNVLILENKMPQKGYQKQ